jgi:hypothetical protein
VGSAAPTKHEAPFLPLNVLAYNLLVAFYPPCYRAT